VTIVFAAALAMIVLVLIPARYRYWRLAAVLGWATIWLDGHAGWNAVDLTGLGVAVISLITVVTLQHGNRSGENG